MPVLQSSKGQPDPAAFTREAIANEGAEGGHNEHIAYL